MSLLPSSFTHHPPSPMNDGTDDSPHRRFELDSGTEKGAETDPVIDPSMTQPPTGFPQPDESRFTKREKWLIVILTAVIAFFR